jgi:hypothetical protein
MTAIGFRYAYEEALTASVCAQQGPIFSRIAGFVRFPVEIRTRSAGVLLGDGFAINDGPGQLPCLAAH